MHALQVGHMLECSMGISAFAELPMANMDKLKIQTVALLVQVMQVRNVEEVGECQYIKLVRPNISSMHLSINTFCTSYINTYSHTNTHTHTHTHTCMHTIYT